MDSAYKMCEMLRLSCRWNIAEDSIIKRSRTGRDCDGAITATRKRSSAYSAHARILHRRAFNGCYF